MKTLQQLTQELMQMNDELSQQFAEGVAAYMLTHNLEKYSPDLNMKVWLLGQDGVNDLKKELGE